MPIPSDQRRDKRNVVQPCRRREYPRPTSVARSNDDPVGQPSGLHRTRSPSAAQGPPAPVKELTAFSDAKAGANHVRGSVEAGVATGQTLLWLSEQRRRIVRTIEATRRKRQRQQLSRSQAGPQWRRSRTTISTPASADDVYHPAYNVSRRGSARLTAILHDAHADRRPPTRSRRVRTDAGLSRCCSAACRRSSGASLDSADRFQVLRGGPGRGNPMPHFCRERPVLSRCYRRASTIG